MDHSIPIPDDPLGAALHQLRMSGAFYCRSELSAPWGIDLPPVESSLMFHVVTTGRARLEVPGEPAVVLEPGGFALVPHGQGHVLRGSPGAAAAPLFDLPRVELTDSYELLRHGGGGEETTMVCGAIHFDHPAAGQLLGALPHLIHVDAWGSTEGDWLMNTLRFMATEARSTRPGGAAILTRLCDVLVILAIRAWLDQDPSARRGWLGALRDESLGRALTAVHLDPSYPWTVATLAERAHMSRSAFSARFTEVLGEPPMGYVTRWRMTVAQDLLAQDSLPVAQVAHRMGYQSEASFARAFKRATGVTPGAVRRGARS